jgi:hypothetical protein
MYARHKEARCAKEVGPWCASTWRNSSEVHSGNELAASHYLGLNGVSSRRRRWRRARQSWWPIGCSNGAVARELRSGKGCGSGNGGVAVVALWEGWRRRDIESGEWGRMSVMRCLILLTPAKRMGPSPAYGQHMVARRCARSATISPSANSNRLEADWNRDFNHPELLIHSSVAISLLTKVVELHASSNFA